MEIRVDINTILAASISSFSYSWEKMTAELATGMARMIRVIPLINGSAISCFSKGHAAVGITSWISRENQYVRASFHTSIKGIFAKITPISIMARGVVMEPIRFKAFPAAKGQGMEKP